MTRATSEEESRGAESEMREEREAERLAREAAEEAEAGDTSEGAVPEEEAEW